MNLVKMAKAMLLLNQIKTIIMKSYQITQGGIDLFVDSKKI